MSRAHGKHTSRTPVLSPGEKAEFGIDDRDIPGGETHLINHQTVHQKPATSEPLEEFRGMMAHGVPPAEHGMYDRDAKGKKPYKPEYAKVPAPPVPVPVYIVEDGGGGRALRSAAPRHFTVPAASGTNAGDPVRVCGRDARRVRVLLLNEDTASNIRFAQRPSDLTAGGGALLPYPSSSYLALHTQDELWALSADTGTPLISVIQEFEREEAG